MAQSIVKKWSLVLGVAATTFGSPATMIRVEAAEQGLSLQSPTFATPITTNAAASISVTSPAANSVFVTPSEVTVTAAVKVPKGADAITQVEFYVDAKHVATARTAPYTFVWAVTIAKPYALSAIARTIRGAAVYSASVPVVIQGAAAANGHPKTGTPSPGTPSTGAPTAPLPTAPTAPTSAVLPIGNMAVVQKESLVYQGSFALPSQEINGSRFGYGGTAMAFNRERGTLFLVGHDSHQKAAEITIPEIRRDLSALDRAQIVQPFFDPTDGKWAAIGTRDMAKVGGILPWGDKLIVSMFHYYDANGTQSRSHFVSGRDLSVSQDAQGPFRVGSLKTGYVSGYMGHIPEAWQAALGGPALTGNCCIPIISRTSYGPALFSFDPDDVGRKDQVPANPLLYYPSDRPLAAWNATSPYFNGTTEITGIVFPEGTQSVLFFGKHGLGAFCYGTTCFPGAGQGNHAPPYVTQVWAYNAADLAAVRAGSKQPWDLRPYAVWQLNFPSEGSKKIEGVAYDPATQRIFISQLRGENPLVHVYDLQLN